MVRDISSFFLLQTKKVVNSSAIVAEKKIETDTIHVKQNLCTPFDENYVNGGILNLVQLKFLRNSSAENKKSQNYMN